MKRRNRTSKITHENAVRLKIAAAISVILCVMLSAIGCGDTPSKFRSEIFGYVIENEQVLDAAVKELYDADITQANSDLEKLISEHNIECISAKIASGSIEFLYRSVPVDDGQIGAMEGYYYSDNGEPLAAIGGEEFVIEKSGAGWKSADWEGITYYTEKIIGAYYYYYIWGP
jgi:hypothetical protein